MSEAAPSRAAVLETVAGLIREIIDKAIAIDGGWTAM